MQGTEYGDAALKQAMAAELRERLVLAEKEQRPLRVYCRVRSRPPPICTSGIP